MGCGIPGFLFPGRQDMLFGMIFVSMPEKPWILDFQNVEPVAPEVFKESFRV